MSVINGATNAITNITNPLGSNTGWIAVNPATNRIYPPGGTPPSSFIPAYLIINGSTNSVTESAPFYFPLGTSTGAPDVAADALYTDGISDAGPTFLVYQVDANSWTDFGDCAVGPSLLLADPVSHLVYEGYSGFGVIDPATQSYPVCAQSPIVNAQALTQNTLTNTVYVLSGFDRRIGIVAGAPPFTTTELAGPGGVVLINIVANPVTNKIYVAASTAALGTPSEIEVIDGATNTTAALLSLPGEEAACQCGPARSAAAISKLVTFIAGLDDTRLLIQPTHVRFSIPDAPPPPYPGPPLYPCSTYWDDHSASISPGPTPYPDLLPGHLRLYA